MSLNIALQAALKGMIVSQEAIATSSHNLANANTEGYATQSIKQESIVTSGVGQGARISGVFSDVDPQLLKSIQDQASLLGKSSTVSDIMKKAGQLYGNPNSGTSLSDLIDKFFTSIETLNENPNVNSIKLAAVTAAENLAAKISSIATGLEDLRFEADSQLKSTISSINSLVDKLKATNANVSKFAENTSGRLEIDQKRSILLNQLSELIDIKTVENSTGKLSITTGSGVALLDTFAYQLSYNNAASRDVFVQDQSLNAVLSNPIKDDGSSVSGNTTALISSGKSSEVTSGIVSGVMRGLLDVRDTEITKLLDQLDNLASVITDEVNKIHNDGVSFPPPSSLTGTREVLANTEIGFSGSVRIAVVNNDGTPALSPFTDESYYRPLDLNLGALDSGDGAGYPTVQTIIDEINDYFGPAQPRVALGNLRDIRLAAISDSISDAGTFQFDLELDNTSYQDATVVVNAVTVIDPIGGSTGYTPIATLPSPNSYVINSGDRERTGIPITIGFATDDNRASYTVRVQVQVTAADGTVSTADIDYTVSDNVTGIKNDRYNATASTLIGTDGSTTYFPAPTSERFATARLVDANGNAIVAGASGYLQITTASGKNYGIAIDELTSSEVGLSTTATADITNRGFSHYFELNNFFVANNDTVKNTAINMDLTDAIKADPNAIATGELTLSNQPTSSTEVALTYELGSGNNKVVNRLSKLDQSNVLFNSAGTIARTTTTIANYSGDLIGFVATKSSVAAANFDTESQAFDALKSVFQQSAGVNTDKELAGIIEFENYFSSSAQVISIVRSLFQTLNGIFS